ncbi:hypothetical protein PR001_g17872 [Phytophthora rubi]|uniref:RxLR effector protein n=1 Tax=Phytophthora rubi TaxID=129364 RepID=A0A6A3K4Q9_9STRA|nr:hypothetical protein PR002_g17960 [Phytophthora rubi]KAE9003843.1 hypothetical protein PR001_g17872 [Phytophthora rubi]
MLRGVLRILCWRSWAGAGVLLNGTCSPPNSVLTMSILPSPPTKKKSGPVCKTIILL